MKTTTSKIFKLLVLGTTLLLLSAALISCGKISNFETAEKSTESELETQDNAEMSQIELLKTYYAQAEALGYQGSLEDFLNLVKGSNGIGIADITLSETGNLVVSLSDGSVIDLGKIGPEINILSEIKVTEEKTLLVTFGNGISFETAPLDITFGGYVNGLCINSAYELEIYTSTGETNNYGKISKIYISETDELMIAFENGEPLSFGSVKVTGTGYVCEHEYGDWETVIAPTCTSIGYNKAVCASCSNEKTEFVEKLGHDYKDSVVIKEPTAYEDGVQITVCRVCGDTKTEFINGFSLGLSYEKTDREEYRVTGIGTCEDTNIIVPDEYEGLPVTEIADRAFFGCDELVSIFLPDTIVKVGDKAFSECESLAEVRMPDYVEVGTDVFRGSIQVEIVIRHPLVFVEAKEATCTEPGNIAHYWCETCQLPYEDSNGTIRLYDVLIPGSHEFVDGVCVMCGMIQNEVLIVDIDSVAHLGKFALGTLSTAIGAPDYINVYTADGRTHTLEVQWDFSAYDKANVGEYTITGSIQSGMFHYTDGLSNKISTQVEIVDYMKGTADIVFVLDISGSMEDEINNVKNNIQRLAQSIDDMGVSARWAAITYSDFTIYEPNEESTIVMNGANNWYTDVNAYKTAIGNISLAYGGDEPEAAVDGLLLANTMETRKDARVFYILLTDATYKVDNHYGASSMQDVANTLKDQSINTSVITSTDLYYNYNDLTSTGGIQANIYSNFADDLINSLVPIIFGEVME